MTEKELLNNLKDRRWRLRNLYYIKNEQGKKVKFLFRPAQDKFFKSMHTRNCILKSRQHGFTTALGVYALDLILFNSNFRCGFLAHDKDSAEDIFFDKILFTYENLPTWLKNLRSKIRRSSKVLVVRHGSNNYSSIRVATSLRSGTYQFVHISEFGKMCARYPQKAKEVVTGTLPAAPADATVVVESTAEGAFGEFYRMCNEAQTATGNHELTSMDFKFHFYGWFENPSATLEETMVIDKQTQEYFDFLAAGGIELTDNQKNYYVKIKKQYGENVTQEYPSTPEEAFQKKIKGAYYADLLSKLRGQGRIGHCPYDSMLPVYTFWDLGISDSMSIWFAQFTGQEIRLIDYYENNNQPLPHYAKYLQALDYVYAGHYGPHDLAVRELGTGLTRQQILAKLGIKITYLPALQVSSGIEAARAILPKCFFDVNKCDRGITALDNYRKAYNEKLERYEDTPLHDWSSHAADAFRYLALSYELGKISHITSVSESILPAQEQNNYNPFDMM